MGKARTGSLLGALLVLIAVTLLDAGEARAARRAFVVGNANYAHAPVLANPVNDARDLAARLKASGYVVTLGLDLKRAELLASFQRFMQSMQQDDVALFFFAGHAMQVGGENYLFPVDAQIEREEDARTRLAALNAFLADLSRASKSRIVILDACRNNPFAEDIGKQQTRAIGGATRGLARVYAGVGSFIAYSTQPGNVALDGSGRNSPFTEALLRHMTVAGADVHAVMRRVRADVQKVTSEQQIPWENSSLVDELEFTAVAATAPSPPSASPVPPPAKSPPPAVAAPLPAESYSYVSGLDPNGDNFLALRTSPTESGQRIATMGPGTLLKVAESSGPWRRVVLADGTSGWAHSRWIACCRTVALGRDASQAKPATVTAPVPPAPESCDDLWHRRNAIWKKHGYCFTGTKGKQVFGNAGCSRDEAATRAAMSAAERETVDALAARERALGCR